MKKLLLPVLLLISVLLKAQPDDYYSVTSLRTENRIYIPNLKTPCFIPLTIPLGCP